MCLLGSGSMIKVSLCLLLITVIASPALGDISKKNIISKTKSGGKGGFYSSRFGSVYNARDFAPDVPTTAAPQLLREHQLPSGVAGPHQQNLDGEIRVEIPNVEESTFGGPSMVSDDLRQGVKGTKGVKGGVKGYKSNQPRFDAFTEPPSIFGVPTTLTPDVTETVIRLSVHPNGSPTTENIVKKKTKTKGTKGGRRGYQYEVPNIKDRFSDDHVTEAPVDFTTVESYTPQILHLPTERHVSFVTTTENYRQETIAPVQQTELPIQQTELPVQQTELPVQQTELPVQQTELPIQQTEDPRREPTTTWRPTVPPTTYEPLQDTQSPEDPQVTVVPDLPIQTTISPTTTEYFNDQQTELPQVTQLPEEPVQTTVQPDEFARFPLGLEGRHLIKGAKDGKTKGKGSSKSVKSLKSTPKVRLPDSLYLNRRRDPSEPLLPSLLPRH